MQPPKLLLPIHCHNEYESALGVIDGMDRRKSLRPLSEKDRQYYDETKLRLSFYIDADGDIEHQKHMHSERVRLIEIDQVNAN